MKSTAKILICLMIVVFASTSVLAAQGGNPKKGKYLYKKNCKSCHSEGSAGGELTPMSKTMSQWDRVFKRGKHEGGMDAWENLSEQDLKDINQFLYDHAADSPSPQTCG